MQKLKEKVNAFWRAAEELENCAIRIAADSRSKLELAQSRLMRDKVLDAQVRGARAERNILNIPITRNTAVTQKK